MNRKALDPNLASILDSIRATVGADAAAAPAYSGPDEPAEQAAEAAAPPEAVAHETGEPAATRPAKAKTARRAALPPAADGRSIEDFLADLIRPQVKEWLDAHLPELIQKMAADEIARLIGSK